MADMDVKRYLGNKNLGGMKVDHGGEELKHEAVPQPGHPSTQLKANDYTKELDDTRHIKQYRPEYDDYIKQMRD